MGALILKRRRNQSLFEEPGGLNREEIYAAGAAANDGSVYYETRFDGWWVNVGKSQSNLTYSDARKAFIEGWKSANAEQQEEGEKLDKWDIRQEGARRADAAEADHWRKTDRQLWGERHFKIWWDGFGKRESGLGPINSKEEFLRGWMATHDDRRDNPDDREHERYYARQAADDAWQAELERVYGRAASDARYDARGKATPKLKELHRRWRDLMQPNSGSRGTRGRRNPHDPREESVQDKSYREWRENFQQVSDDPETATISQLERAIHYLDHTRNRIQRAAWDEGRQVDGNVIAGFDAEEQFYRRLIQQKRGRR